LSRNVLVLSLDSTTRAGSVAVARDGELLSQLVGDPSLTQGARLPADLMRALDLARVSLAAIDLLAVATGPGSFTGLRVGIAAMQGVAMATGKSIVPVPVLEALAVAGANGRSLLGAWMDAQRGEVFAALYDAAAKETLIEATALDPLRTLDMWTSTPTERSIRFIGDGAIRYAEAIRERLGSTAEIVAPPPLAGVIGSIAVAAPHRAVLPHAVVPVYVRKPDAELAKAKPK
jgi:tRNA threonylcarbamoyladenosine biosynthesis protein TsaB